MKNKKCISLTLVALLMLTGCGAKESDSAANADQAGKKVLTFGCQMYTDGIVNTVTDENGGWNAMRYGITEGLFKFNDSMEVEPWLADSYTAVSYTHLDVYKRQAQDCQHRCRYTYDPQWNIIHLQAGPAW